MTVTMDNKDNKNQNKDHASQHRPGACSKRLVCHDTQLSCLFLAGMCHML